MAWDIKFGVSLTWYYQFFSIILGHMGSAQKEYKALNNTKLVIEIVKTINSKNRMIKRDFELALLTLCLDESFCSSLTILDGLKNGLESDLEND